MIAIKLSQYTEGFLWETKTSFNIGNLWDLNENHECSCHRKMAKNNVLYKVHVFEFLPASI